MEATPINRILCKCHHLTDDSAIPFYPSLFFTIWLDSNITSIYSSNAGQVLLTILYQFIFAVGDGTTELLSCLARWDIYRQTLQINSILLIVFIGLYNAPTLHYAWKFIIILDYWWDVKAYRVQDNYIIRTSILRSFILSFNFHLPSLCPCHM